MARVCIVRMDYFPQNIHVRRNVQALVADGFDVDLICIKRPGQKAKEQLEGVQVYRLPLNKRRGGLFRYVYEYSIFFLITFIALSMLSIWRRYEVVEVDSMPDFLAFTAIIPKLFGARVVLYLMECMPEMFEHGYGLSTGHPMVRLLRFTERHASRFADHVIYCGPGYRAIQEPRAGKAIPGTVVLNVPMESIFASDRAIAPREDLTSKAFRVITHGTILERYGISTLIEAVPLLIEDIPNLEVMIVGDGEQKPLLEELATELGVRRYVTFTGRVPLEEVPDLISQADVGVATFLHDCGLAWKLFEYMAMRRPIVHSATKFTLDFCQNDEILFFNPGDKHELAERLLWLYRHTEERLAMIQRATLLYEACRWSVTRESYLNIYRQFIDYRNRRRRVSVTTDGPEIADE